MKRLFFAIIMVVTFAVSAQATDVGVSVSVGQPGFYGRIDIGNLPEPQVIYPQPVVIHPVPAGVTYRPLYLRVPPGHEKHWKKHCHRYNACGRPVYFVQNNWYEDVYVPKYQARQGHGGGHHGNGKKNHHKGGRHGHGKGNGKK